MLIFDGGIVQQYFFRAIRHDPEDAQYFQELLEGRQSGQPFEHPPYPGPGFAGESHTVSGLFKQAAYSGQFRCFVKGFA